MSIGTHGTILPRQKVGPCKHGRFSIFSAGEHEVMHRDVAKLNTSFVYFVVSRKLLLLMQLNGNMQVNMML